MKLPEWWPRNPFLQPMVLLVITGLILELIFIFTGLHTPYALTAYIVIGLTTAVTAVGMVQDLKAGHWGLDVLAVVAMIATLAVGEYLAGTIIALMLTGGEALEELAAGRASRELDALINRRPSVAHRVGADGTTIERIDLHDVEVGDELLVRGSEVLPVDGTLLSQRASLDESSVTGEPIPVTHVRGDEVLSGTTNGTESFRMQATHTAKDSHYASIVKLVEEAVNSQAPMVRLADRYAVPFTIVALLLAGFAWYWSGDPVRFAEVLVVATPCPLLIGAPVSFMGGMSSAAKINVIVKDGGTLERLARVRGAGFDKTGTLTRGTPTVSHIAAHHGTEDELLGLAASAEQYSTHVFAAPIIDYARAQGVSLSPINGAEEIATNGVEAQLQDGSKVRVGKSSFIAETTGHGDLEQLQAGETAVYVSRNDVFLGSIILSDPLREQSPAMIASLRDQGVEEILLATGDTETTAHAIAQQVGIDRVHANVTPADKVQIVTHDLPRPSLMVGDGINDAPVLAAADVGIAMGAKGATAASESADAVLTSENIMRVADVMHIAKRTVQIALQSIWFGLSISIILMIIAALGYLPAVAGALLQEVVDLVAIGIALRALRLTRDLPSDGRKAEEAPAPAEAKMSS